MKKIALVVSILVASLIASSTVVVGSSIPKAFAKTTHEYCYVIKLFNGPIESASAHNCYKTLSNCQSSLAATPNQEGIYTVKITKGCTRVTNSDKSTNNYCYDILPNDGIVCWSSKKECESQRELATASLKGFRTGPECYKIK